MVRQLIRMKASMIINTLTQQKWMLVMSILGLIYMLFIIGTLYVGVIFTVLTGEITSVIVGSTIGVALLTLGWTIVAPLISGADSVMEPKRFASFMAPTWRFALGLIIVAGVGIGGIISLLLAVLPGLAFLLNGDIVTAFLALIGTFLHLFIGFTWSRVFAAWLSDRLSASSSRKEMTTAIVAIVFIGVMAPMGLWIQYLSEGITVEMLETAYDVIGWTPLAAGFSAVGQLWSGSWGVAFAQFLIAVAWAGLGVVLWHYLLRNQMADRARPVSRAADLAIAEGHHLIDPTKDAKGKRLVMAGSGSDLGVSDSHGAAVADSVEAPKSFLARVEWWQRLGLTPATASMVARTSRYWLRDARIMIGPPAALIFYMFPIIFSKIYDFDAEVGVGNFFIYFAPVMLGMTVGSLAQYDSTALWIVVSSRMHGWEERLGRFLGSLPINLSVVLVGTALFSMTVGQGRSTAEIVVLVLVQVSLFVGSTVGTLALGSVWVYPVQAPGTSPLATKGTGNMTSTILIQTVSMVVAVVINLPVIIAVGFFWGGGVSVWVPAVIAPVWTLVVAVVGIWWAGRLWDRNKVRLLTTIRSWPGH